ncbi:hypothetical protein ACIQBJ_11415 [Kitasatospora sp. NPDC088391]|uniref:hypothetical protein n=1 Tax=Kitasatospora sp. NPDC088391 TaxID=3364074 RepID=UPI00382F35A3
MSEPHRPDPGAGLTEDQLRARLHRAVAAVEPGPGALPRLRTAVPRRRAARRRALGGAAVLAAAVAVLPVVNATGPFDLSGDPAGGPAVPAPPPGPTPSAGGRSAHPHSGTGEPVIGPGGGASPAASTSTEPGPGTAAAVPACEPADLGRAAAQQAVADPAGRVYGWFQLTNTTARACRVQGPGRLDLAGAATGVQLLAHTVGDPAGSLADPAALPSGLLLGPGSAYLVRFAWVPTRCGDPTTTPSGPSSTQPVPAAASLAAPAADPGPAQPLTAVAADPSPTGTPTPGPTPGPTPPTGPVLGYVPDRATAPAATTALPSDCGGTVYFTGPEPAPVPAGAAPSPTQGA